MKLKVKKKYDWNKRPYEVELSQLTQHALECNDEGAVENVTQSVRNTIHVLGKLMTLLIEKDLITSQEALNVISKFDGELELDLS